MNHEAEALALVTRDRRNHRKDHKNNRDEDARHARIRRKSMIQKEMEDDDWLDYVDR
jgi:DNA-binding XRE family transcriptional regulator